MKGQEDVDNFNSLKFKEVKSYFEKTCLALSEQAEIITGPLQLGFDITNRCPMRCRHCFNRSNSLKRDELSDGQVLHVFNEIAHIRPQQMCICGGEPLVRVDMVLEGARRLKEAGIALGMVSNGFLFTKKIAQSFAVIGFDQIQISLDGFRESHDHLRGLKGAYHKAVNAIKLLTEQGVKVITSFSPTKMNIPEFEEYIDFIRSIGVREIRVQPLMLMGEAFFNTDIFPSDEQYEHMVRIIKQHTYDCARHDSDDQKYNIPVVWGDPVDHIIRFSSYITKPTFAFQINSIGKINISPYLPITVGDLKRYGLRDYWEAGLNKIWETPLFQMCAERVRGIQTLGTALKPVYFGDGVDIDLIDDPPEVILDKTNSFLGKSTTCI
jgi:MoaA/NifB/PqqE/SkfB family radical SAM enzyme